MPCNSPNKIFYNGLKANGKRNIIFTSRDTDFVRLHSDGSYECWKGSDDRFSLGRDDLILKESDLVPCGQCIGCRLDYARSWAGRLMLEKSHFPDDECFFITLTYDDEHLPPKQVVYPEDGQPFLSQFHSVSVRDHQLFMKRLRDRFGEGLRFFASLEYGEKSLRPHEHIIVFGLKGMKLGRFDKKRNFIEGQPYKSNFRGDELFECYQLTGPTGAWTDEHGKPIGMALCSHVTFDTCNYVTRYVVKKRKKIDKKWYSKAGVESERCIMSRKPGIGKEYFEGHYDDIYTSDEINFAGRDGRISIRPPRYFDSLLDKLDPERLLVVKDDRRVFMDNSENFRKFHLPHTDLEDIYSARERKLADKIIVKKGETL